MSEQHAPPSETPEALPLEKLSYLSMVWARMKKSRVTVVGVWCIGVLLLAAIAAPLLSFNQPFYWNAGDRVEFPFIRGLFNRLLFENTIDLLFNLALVLSPGYAAIFLWQKRRYGRRFYLVRAQLVVALVGVHLLITFTCSTERYFGLENPLYFTEQVVDYTAKAQQLEQEGKSVSAIFPLRPNGYRETDSNKSVLAPTAQHWFGTDSEGRDVFARMLYGTRISLTIGVVAVFIYVLIGIALGSAAGYFGGWVDSTISRLIEVMICFPSFFLILTIAALIEQRSIFHVMVIIGVTSWTGVARLIRAEFLKHKQLEYTQAAQALGVGHARVIFRHILPNAIAPVLVSATFGIASAILIESSLAFLGIGDLSVASWGEILNNGRVQGKLWLVLAPGLAIFFVVSVFNLVGEGLRDALDPKLRS